MLPRNQVAKLNLKIGLGKLFSSQEESGRGRTLFFLQRFVFHKRRATFHWKGDFKVQFMKKKKPNKNVSFHGEQNPEHCQQLYRSTHRYLIFCLCSRSSRFHEIFCFTSLKMTRGLGFDTSDKQHLFPSCG